MKLAFCIPAYNNPKYLYQCLKSLINQKNLNFDILISDDCSPVDLWPVILAIKSECNDCISINYIKQECNLGIYWNTRYVFETASHPYRVLLQHDDFIIDEFYSDKILNIFDQNEKCSAAIFNAVTEHSKNDTYIHIGKQFYDGKSFLADHLFKDIHPSYSSVALNTKFLDRSLYLSTFVPKIDANYMRVEVDECFQILSLVLIEGDVFVSDDITTVRGEPSTSATQLNTLPFKTAAQGMLISYYQLYKIMKLKCLGECSNEMLRLMTKVFPSPTINIKMIKYFNFDLCFIKIHLVGVIFRNLMRIKRILNAVF